eukprot:11019137-Karenia_brevis.AAC.1
MRRHSSSHVELGMRGHVSPCVGPRSGAHSSPAPPVFCSSCIETVFGSEDVQRQEERRCSEEGVAKMFRRRSSAD